MVGRRPIVSQAEIKRTLQAALSAGMRIGKYEVDHTKGRIVVFAEGVEGQVGGPDPDELLR